MHITEIINIAAPFLTGIAGIAVGGVIQSHVAKINAKGKSEYEFLVTKKREVEMAAHSIRELISEMSVGRLRPIAGRSYASARGERERVVLSGDEAIRKAVQEITARRVLLPEDRARFVSDEQMLKANSDELILEKLKQFHCSLEEEQRSIEVRFRKSP